MVNPFQKLSFEYKFLGAFFFMLLVGISALNFVAVRLHKAELMEGLWEEVELHLALYARGGHRLPPYIIVSDLPVKGEDLVLYDPSFEGKFVFVDFGPVKARLRNFSLGLLLWEAFLVLSLSYLFYKVLWRFLKEREQNRRFLELVLLILSHRLGNFLATQRVNLEILREGGPGALERLSETYDQMERQFRRTVDLIRSFPMGMQEKEEIDLKELIRESLKPFGPGLDGKRVNLHLEGITVRAPKAEVEMVFNLLLENAVRYSRSYVEVGLTKDERGVEIRIKNDILQGISGGSGIGLELARRLAKEIGAVLEVSEREGCFVQRMVLPHSSALRFKV